MNKFTKKDLLIFLALMISMSGFAQDDLSIADLNKENYEVTQ